jgi:GTP-binding protein YchF
MKLGIVGLPNVGKSTLFNAITKAGAQCANYPFCTIEPNVGVVGVPDYRLAALAAIYSSRSVVPATVEFVDIAGLVKGASKGEGLGNKFLSHIREVDAIAHVVRAFDDSSITHVDGAVDPLRDIETIELELILADLESVEKKLDKAKSLIKTGDKKYILQSEALQKVYDHLGRQLPARSLALDENETPFVEELFLLTSKPIIYVANISEDYIQDPYSSAYVKIIDNYAGQNNAECVALCAKIEEELCQLDDDDRKMFMRELGIKTSGLDLLVSACYKLLGLISFLTAGEKETRAWTIKKGTKAAQAAGKIHSDFERGFIRAEVVDFDTLINCGSFNAAKEKGKVRSEGRDYVVKDGDVMLFKFNV